MSSLYQEGSLLSKKDAVPALRRLFQRFPVVDLERLQQTLDTRSRMSAFRRLKELGYRSSFTHAGRYYTLADIPQFDEHGLWFRQGIGFSRAGTLKATVVELVGGADAGRTHSELEQLLRVRVYNALLGLVQERRIGRERIDRWYLYVDSDAGRAAEQVLRRREQVAAATRAEVSGPLPPAMTIEVLAEALLASGVAVAPPEVARRLLARGIRVTAEQVEEVFVRYGMDAQKKTPPPRPPSRA